MKEKLILCAVLGLLAFLYIYCAPQKSKNPEKEISKAEQNINFKNNLSSNSPTTKPQKNPAPIQRKIHTNNGVKRSTSTISPEEIRRREQAVLDNFKIQQLSKKQSPNRVGYSQTNRNTSYNKNNLDGYLLGNMQIDAPPNAEQMKVNSVHSREYYIKQNLEQGDRYININPPTALSYKSKQEIFNERKRYVSESLFAYPDYEPSEEVLGQIEDGKPWISTNLCLNSDDSTRTDGTSEESRFLNNPSILVGINDNKMKKLDNGADNNPYCHYLLMPKSAKYIKDENVIEVIYNSLPDVANRELPYRLVGINARDFGYEYARFDNNKSKNVFMLNFTSIQSEVTQFKDFIHKGGSCGVPGGCNNGSPRQPKLEFYYANPDQETVMYIKLWREMPKSYMEPADINQKIIILPKN